VSDAFPYLLVLHQTVRESDRVRQGQTESDSQIFSVESIRVEVESDRVRLDQTESDRVRLDQSESDRVRQSQTESDSQRQW
jgi:hypothetical protein